MTLAAGIHIKLKQQVPSIVMKSADFQVNTLHRLFNAPDLQKYCVKEIECGLKALG